jgi:hypothetical protein
VEILPKEVTIVEKVVVVERERTPPEFMPKDLVTISLMGYDTDKVPYHGDHVTKYIDHDVKIAISRAQLWMGLTVDGDLGPKTESEVQRHLLHPTLRQREIWYGDPIVPHQHGRDGRAWSIDSEGYVKTDYDIVVSGELLRHAKLIVRNNRKHILEEHDDNMRKLIYSCILTESSGKKDATRYEPHLDDYSYGLMQILYTTAKTLGFDGEPEELLDPLTNIAWGSELIAKQQYKNLGDPVLTAAAYNAGGVYESGSNQWRMRCYGSPNLCHIDKFIRNWNAVTMANIDGYEL